MARSKKTGGPIPVEAVKHKDKRVNIPTEELRDFVAEDEARPDTLLYPRDPSLDPQLVWKGEDEPGREPAEGRRPLPPYRWPCSPTSTGWSSRS